MARPSHIVCDTDVLIQVFKSQFLNLLHKFSNKYGITVLVTNEVYTEFCVDSASPSSKWLDGQIKNKSVVEVNQSTIGTVNWANFSARATTFATFIGSGEASVFAYAEASQQLAASNDGNALKTLKQNSITLGCHVARSFDLFVLCAQSQLISTNDIGKIVGRLKTLRERVPPSFNNPVNISSCLQQFEARIYDGNCLPLGPVSKSAVVL